MLLLLQWHRSACSDPGNICIDVTESKSESHLLWGTSLPGTAPHNQTPCWVTHSATNPARSTQRVLFRVSLGFKPHHWWKDDYAAHLHQTGLSSIPENCLVCNSSVFVLVACLHSFGIRGLYHAGALGRCQLCIATTHWDWGEREFLELRCWHFNIKSLQIMMIAILRSTDLGICL